MNAVRLDLGLAPRASLGQLTLHPAAREIVRADGLSEVVEPRIMQVLLVLAEHRGEVVRREDLTQRCWGGVIVGEDAINRVISRLRRLSAGLGAGSFRIETITKTGYRLIELLDGRDFPGPGGGWPGLPEPAPAAEPVDTAVAAPGRSRLAIGATLIVLVALLVAAVLWWRHRNGDAAAQAMPADPAAAALLIQARDDWAQRTSDSLSRSIQAFQKVNRVAPDFAPAYADLADAYLLAGEAGSLSDDVSFDGAEHAAARAIAIDPRSMGAQRAMGFILYWRRHDAAGAAAAFRTALAIDPDAAQTHFWFANILADNGSADAAAREFTAARLADPGSDQIGADYAWSLWIVGRDREAEAQLRAIVSRRPDIAEAWDCLNAVALSNGDYPEFLKALHEVARLRGEAVLESQTVALETAFTRGGAQALLATAFAQESASQRSAAYPDHALAAHYASLAGDRAALMRTLATARTEHESWGSAGYVRRIRQRWAQDPVVIAALDPLIAPRIG